VELEGSAARAVRGLRDRMINGELAPGVSLPEAKWAAVLGVSRNTLREAFSTLIEEQLLVREPHRGVFVATLTPAQISDVYRVRVLLECSALERAPTDPPEASAMRAAVEAGRTAAGQRRWREAGTANMHFHEHIVALAGSPRLDAWMRQLTAELRLSFFSAPDLEALHRPFVALNDDITRAYESGDARGAAILLRDYLLTSERIVLGNLR
jgi:DNA-binding GntR family transcriptional regulator